MDIETLRYVLALNEYSSFSAAADECNISQSSFSKHIQHAEAELGGVQLFERTSRPLKITAAGREFVSYARQIVDKYDDLESHMKQFSARYQNELVIGSIPIMNAVGITDLLQHFKKGLKGEEKVIIRDLPNKELIRELQKGNLDLAFLINPLDRPELTHLTNYMLRKYELLLVVNPLDPLALKDHADWSDLIGRQFISQDENTQIYSLMQESYEKHNLNTANISTMRNITSIVESVEAGFGVTMLSAHVLADYARSRIRAVKMSDPITYSLFITCAGKGGIKPLTRRFVNMALDWKYK